MLFKQLWNLVINTETVMFHGNYMDEHVLLQHIATFNKENIIEGVRGCVVPRWDDSELLCEIEWQNDDVELEREQIVKFLQWLERIAAHSWSIVEFWNLEEMKKYHK